MDHGTGWTLAHALPQRSAETVLNMLSEIITTYGKPTTVLTDNGAEFDSDSVQLYFRRATINHVRTSPYHPQTNGRLEKFNDTCVQILARKCAPEGQHNWDMFLPEALFAYRAHNTRTTGASPFFLTFGREPRLPSDSHFDDIKKPPTINEILQIREHRQKHVQDLEQHRLEANTRALDKLSQEATRQDDTYRERGFAIGDLVRRVVGQRHSKIHPVWDGPFIIRDITNKNTYQLQTRNGHILRHLYNGERLARYIPSNLTHDVWYGSAELQRKSAAAALQQTFNDRVTARRAPPDIHQS
jgi:hypothetical protein